MKKPNIFRIIYVIDKGFVPKIFSLLILERENITNLTSLEYGLLGPVQLGLLSWACPG